MNESSRSSFGFRRWMLIIFSYRYSRFLWLPQGRSTSPVGFVASRKQQISSSSSIKAGSYARPRAVDISIALDLSQSLGLVENKNKQLSPEAGLLMKVIQEA
jgi:hypothetical protein